MRRPTRLGLFLTTAAVLLAACSGGPSTAEHAQLTAWQWRIEGHTVSYHISVGCFCAVGEWRVVERDGVVVESEFLGEGEPDSDRPTISLSEGLRLANEADGSVELTDVTDTGFALSVDEDEDTMDDEWGITVSEFAIED